MWIWMLLEKVFFFIRRKYNELDISTDFVHRIATAAAFFLSSWLDFLLPNEHRYKSDVIAISTVKSY